jgi:hypothetical protein
VDSGGSQVFSPPAATLDTASMNPPGVTIDTPPRGDTAAFTGLVADMPPAETLRSIAEGQAISFRDNPERAEMLARALATTVRQEIERLECQRRNEPEWREQIDFLHAVADALDNIVTAISEARRAATPEAREQKFGEVGRLATSVAVAAKEFAERNYERVTDYGGYCIMTFLGTLLFTMTLGASPDVALAAQLAMLGLFGKKKE